jgi:dihydroxyacetone kinase-like protein
MTLNVGDLRGAIARLTAAMERDFDALNTADGALGDGDLGVTLTRGMRAITELSPGLPDDLGSALLACAQAFTKTSGSSYGTLMATGLMSMAKVLRGRTSVEPSEVSALIAGARDAMQARGKAELGGKTVLDSLDAMAKATAGLTDPIAVAEAAAVSAAAAQTEMKGKLATVGRARIFGEKTIGMDDPGMLAMTAIAGAIAGR